MCDYCDDTGEIETDNNGPIGPCPVCMSAGATGYVAMPKELTAENGAKALLIGEFFVEESVQCPECEGYGYHMHPPDNEKIECDLCKGALSVIEKHPIPWTTIKEIYAMAVKHLAI